LFVALQVMVGFTTPIVPEVGLAVIVTTGVLTVGVYVMVNDSAVPPNTVTEFPLPCELLIEVV